MNRNLLTIALSAAAFLVGTAWLQAVPPAAAARRNVLFLSMDDLNNWTGFLKGHPQVKTPNLDRLAARSVVFENAQCVSPICNPSRVAVLTGKQPFNTGVYDIPQYFRDSAVLKDWVTLPEYFQQHGYRTYHAGKVYHHFDRESLWSDPQKWDEMAPDVAKINPGIPRSGGKWPVPFKNGIEGLVQDFDWGPSEQKDADTFDYRNAYWTIQNLKKEHKQPFLWPMARYCRICHGTRRKDILTSIRWTRLSCRKCSIAISTTSRNWVGNSP